MPDSERFDKERLDKLEGKVRGIEVGQQALREHLDDRLDTLSQMVACSQDQPLNAPTWAFVLLSASTAVFALVALIFMADRYLF